MISSGIYFYLSPPLLHLRSLGPRVALVLADPLGEVVADGGDPLQLPEVVKITN